jgi:OmpR family response regulator RpaB
VDKILIIDDDELLCDRLVAYFSLFELTLFTANSASSGLAKMAEISPDLLLLDVMMPEKDGFTLCKEIRAVNTLPIIMLTARGDLSDKVLGLDIGADDYMSKPFEPRELVARIKVLLRRAVPPIQKADTLTFNNLIIYPQQHKVILHGDLVNLTGMEFNLLVLLAKNPGKVFNRDALLNALKGIDADVYTRSIDILMSRLRQKLGDNPKQVTYIKTLRNIGYCFVGKHCEIT